MRYLVVAHQTADSPELRSWLQLARKDDARFRSVLLVPTAPRSYWKAWDVLEDRRTAEHQAERARRLFDESGIPVERVAIGAHDPLDAIEDELRRDRDFDAIVIATLPPGLSRWLRRDLIHQCARRTGMRVVPIVAKSAAEAPPPDPRPRVAAVTGSAPVAQGGSATATLAPPEAALPEFVDAPAPGQAVDVAPTRLARTLRHVPALADAYWTLHAKLEESSGLEPEVGEFVALRVATRQHFTELWQEHVGLARVLGIPDERIVAIEHWSASEDVPFSARDRAVLAYVDAVCQEGSAVTEARELLERYLEQPQVMALTLMIGFYRVAGSFAHALNLGTDAPFVGWNLYAGDSGSQHL